MNVKLFWNIQLIMQIIFILQIVNLNIDKKKDILKTSIFLFLFNCIFVINFSSDVSVTIVIHIINLFSIFFLYKENSQRAIASFSFAYILVCIFNFIQEQNTFVKIAKVLLHKDQVINKYYVINLCFFCLFVILFSFLFTYIKDLMNLISQNIVYSYFIIILGFILDIVMIKDITRNINLSMIILINKVVIINMVLLILAIIYTIIKFDNKINNMSEINEAIEFKNNELRKIKHDYGAQISYLYGLFLLKRYDDLGKALNDIGVNNKKISSAVSISDNKNSIIYKALKPLLDHGIHILLEENIESNYIDINEEDLFTIVNTIANNVIKYVDNEGMIIVKVYEVFENAVIDIESSYVHEKKHIGRIKNLYLNIFEKWEDFYSFNEIKEIVEKNNGEIHIKNKNISTLIRISIPTVASSKNMYSSNIIF